MGEYKKAKTTSNQPVDEYEIIALAKRLNITLEDMKQMSFVSLINTLVSYVEEKPTTRKATKEDIERFVGKK